MKTAWKEIGIVPDSDDEGELLDSQNSGNGEEVTLELPDAEGKSLAVALQPHPEIFAVGNEQTVMGLALTQQESIQEETEIEPSASSSQVVGRRPAQQEHHESTPLSNEYRVLVEEEVDNGRKLCASENFQGHGAVLTEHDLDVRPEAEQISTSYVRLSSPSSTLSSPPASPILESIYLQLSGRRSPVGQEVINPPCTIVIAEDTTPTIEDVRNYENTVRRSLRPRTEAQLHPYLLDAERHRREFTARGLRPMRVGPTESHPGPRVALDPEDADFEAQEVDSQQTVAEEDSQGPSIGEESQQITARSSTELFPDVFNVPSSPIVSRQSSPSPEERLARFRRTLGILRQADEDDELPDIQKLIGRDVPSTEPLPAQAFRTKTYGKRSRRDAATVRRLQDEEIRADLTVDVFDVPQSPPMTSSPDLPEPAIAVRKARHSTSDDENNHLDLDAEALSVAANSPFHVSLPTPATSSTRKRPIGAAEEAIEILSSPSSSPESGEPQSSQSAAPVRMKRLIKGVLPASFVRLGAEATRSTPVQPRLRERRSTSPRSEHIRRGVALPRTGQTTNNSIPSGKNNQLDFLSDESEDEDVFDIHGIVRESEGDSQPGITEFNVGFEMEDNRIDQMLPVAKRQRVLFPDHQPGKAARGSASMFKGQHNEHTHQPRITEVLEDQQPYEHGIRLERTDSLASRIHRKVSTPRRRAVETSIQAAMPEFDTPIVSLPPFIRIAARTAGSRQALGRYGPRRKFIRLDNADDTKVAQSVLTTWRTVAARATGVPRFYRPALQVIDMNRASTYHPPSDFEHQKAGAAAKRSSTSSREPNSARLTTTKRQSRLLFRPQRSGVGSGQGRGPRRPRLQQSRLPYSDLSARPAQLEFMQGTENWRMQQSAFGSTKSRLDRSFVRYQPGVDPVNNIPLSRFLAESGPGEAAFGRQAAEGEKVRDRKRKRRPQHIDASAARYRQPSVPIVIDMVEDFPTAVDSTKPTAAVELKGLQKLIYTKDFDVVPLRTGTYFHESTFIGQGKLAKALLLDMSKYNEGPRGWLTLEIGGESIRFGPWSDAVASNVERVCQWVAGQLRAFASESEDISKAVVEAMVSLVVFWQDYLSFEDFEDPPLAFVRMLSTMQELMECLEVLAGNLKREDNENMRRIAENSTYLTCLTFQVLQMSKTYHGLGNQATSAQLESLFQRGILTSMKSLLTLGFISIQSLYESLHQLSVREAGIQGENWSTQGWVILIHLLRVANIPRFTFWDALNKHILGTIHLENNVAVFEREWQLMFLLLPLLEFDAHGVLILGSRNRTPMENWALPQRIAKRSFEVFAANPKGCHGFERYWRAILDRCHHLIQTWGWRRYGLIMGTLFDIFASYKFDHIEAEGSYRRPEFLSDLDSFLSTSVASDDQSFHIFLKIVHSSIKQLQADGDAKEIRNLVTRLLPNHDLEDRGDSSRANRLRALRNHHDLLFTLYWAAPAELKNKIKTMLDLVDGAKRKQEIEMNGSTLQF
jgi:hypothetical protein